MCERCAKRSKQVELVGPAVRQPAHVISNVSRYVSIQVTSRHAAQCCHAMCLHVRHQTREAGVIIGPLNSATRLLYCHTRSPRVTRETAWLMISPQPMQTLPSTGLHPMAYIRVHRHPPSTKPPTKLTMMFYIRSCVIARSAQVPRIAHQPVSAPPAASFPHLVGLGLRVDPLHRHLQVARVHHLHKSGVAVRVHALILQRDLSKAQPTRDPK